MPTAAPVACGSCGRLNCDAHKFAARRASQRDVDAARKADPFRFIYRLRKWQRTRQYILARDVLCQIGRLCVMRRGVLMPSTDVDHIIPMRAGGDPWDEANLQGACHECHAWKTSLEKTTTKG